MEFEPGPLTALVGEAGSGKSNLLAAIWKVLSAERAAGLEPADATVGGTGTVRIEATLSDGITHALETSGSRQRAHSADGHLHVVFLPASERSAGLTPSGVTDPTVAKALERSLRPPLATFGAVELWLERRTRDLVLLIEEPELFLRPHRQRALYRMLRELAANGNQVMYSTHASTFLNVGRLEEIALVGRRREGGTYVRRPGPLPESEAFRTVSEFDADRSELFLSRAAILVEGRTEKLVFPIFFRSLGYDADVEAISIVDCGGKPNLPVIAEVCNLIELPYLVVHDRDALPGKDPNASERLLNKQIRSVAGRKRTIELARDFEAVANLRGRKHKPERAIEWFSDPGHDVPPQLADVVHRIVALARGV